MAAINNSKAISGSMWNSGIRPDELEYCERNERKMRTTQGDYDVRTPNCPSTYPRLVIQILKNPFQNVVGYFWKTNHVVLGFSELSLEHCSDGFAGGDGNFFINVELKTFLHWFFRCFLQHLFKKNEANFQERTMAWILVTINTRARQFRSASHAGRWGK